MMSAQSSTIIETLKEVTRLNNEGVRFLAICHPSEAHKRFKAALAMVNTHLGASEDFVLDAAPGVGAPQLATLAVPGMEDDTFYIHNQALAFNLEMFGSPEDFQMASSFLVFNLALSCHLGAMKTSSEPTARTACRLYEMCANLALSEEASTAELDCLASSLAVASMNNVAQLTYRLAGNAPKAVEILNSLNPSPELTQTSYMSPEQLDEIILNICTIMATPVVAASAA
ncbi:expressed unknown protein [Seminavis robusta]|uniref:Uncharacterized protein n=1 Tax=Seminavis robusta TaxID=568900 RepID=A0A9N8HXY0_9STRA|nr:expressed unknown protein [Seminavis robusta]|eukprot:Sro3439_g348050.1 n/a (229) ;mRNA; r:4377-5063